MIAVLTVAVAAQNSPFKYPESPIDPLRLAAHIRTLASDAFEGRAPASAGETKTIDYMTRQLVAMGVKAGGDAGGPDGRRWTQDVPLTQSEIEGAVAASFRFGDRVRPLRQGEEVALGSRFFPRTVSPSTAPRWSSSDTGSRRPNANGAISRVSISAGRLAWCSSTIQTSKPT
jgi:hypothetical protein